MLLNWFSIIFFNNRQIWTSYRIAIVKGDKKKPGVNIYLGNGLSDLLETFTDLDISEKNSLSMQCKGILNRIMTIIRDKNIEVCKLILLHGQV